MKYLYMLLLLVVSQTAMAGMTAGRAALHGRVTDSVDGSPVVGASIYFPQLKQGTVSGQDGRYVISQLPAIQTTVQVSYVGHQTIIVHIDLRTVSEMDFTLQENNAMLGEVVVTGLTGASQADRSPSPVAVVSPRTLLETASTNIIDAVAHQPGVSQLTTGSGISKPVIRGLGYNRLVVVDGGIRQEGQQWGDEHGIEVDAQTVHSVEILKGPASLRYGSDAMAGVLVFHEAPVLPQGTMALNVGSEWQSNPGLWGYTANFAGNQQGLVWNWRWSAKDAGEYRNRADGRVPGSQFAEQALTGMLGLNRNWGYSHLKLSYYHLRPGLVEGERSADTGALEPSEAYQQIHHYKVVQDNSFVVGNGTLKAVVGYQQNRRQEYEEAGELGLDFRLHTLNYDLHYLSTTDERWQWSAGVSGMWQRSENLGQEFLIPAYSLFDLGAFASATRHHRRLTVSGGLRLDGRWLHSHALSGPDGQRFSDFSRRFQGLTGSLGAVYRMTDRLHARLNISHGFRAPNLSELGSDGEHEGTFRYELGNAALRPEQSWQADLGVDYSSAVFSVQCAFFANHISHYIFLQRLPGTAADGMGLYQYQQGTARLVGLEAMLDIHPVEPLHFENTFSVVSARQLHQPAESRWLPFTPAPRWTSDLRYDIIRDGRLLNNAYVALGLECWLAQHHVRTAFDTETPTPSYTLLSLSAGTDVRWHGRRAATLLLAVQNLGDRAYQSHLSRLKYAEAPGVSNMGRNVTLRLLVPVAL